MSIVKQAEKLFEDTLRKDLVNLYSTLSGKIRTRSATWTKGFKEHFVHAVEHYGLVKTLIFKHMPVQINQIFVEPKFNLERKSIDYQTLIDRIRARDRIVISAMGGAGKSMTLKHLFANSVKYFPNCYPIFIELRDIDFEESESLLHHISNYFKMFALNYDTDFWYKILKNGKFVLFLDGFDEVRSKNKRKVLNSIKVVDTTFKEIGIVVSTRQDDDIEALQNFYIYNLKPMNKNQAISIISKLEIDETIKSAFVKQLRTSLFTKYNDFLSNPLLLTIMLLTYSSTGKIQGKLHNFYNDAFDTLYERHDALKLLNREYESELGKEELKKVFSAISVVAWRDDDLTFTKKDLKERIDKFVKKRTRLSFSTDGLINDLSNNLCLLPRDSQSNLYTYLHKSFQEYFAAKYIIEHNEPKKRASLLELALDRSGKDGVFLLAYGIDRNIVESEALEPKLKEFIQTARKTSESVMGLIYKGCRIAVKPKTKLLKLTFQFPTSIGLLFRMLPTMTANKSYAKFNFPDLRVYKKTVKELGLIDDLPKYYRCDELFDENQEVYKRLNILTIEDHILEQIKGMVGTKIKRQSSVQDPIDPYRDL